MSDQSTATRASARQRRPEGGNVVTRFFSSIALFMSQVLDEMRKVVRPTRKELTTYTTVVILFVTTVMLFTIAIDALSTRLVGWVFGGA
ncbi:preprotein translocase subunit SecE [Mobilicoccus pelagius]|uniref:Protein translocase subunit SecE n=1 Tax=Mobilicoccus pelagius NBRC 104925 TaxID=1089455 RepID=H5UTS9_9MICO|nr:preprotein translocase subunit SecE [Mobilicoccus pelagius]GAB49137.1 preprotein translocase SecE subunit [Mobilicoccus pelagius NBRC 104925]